MTPWRVVVLLIGAAVVSSFQVGKVPGVLPTLMTDLDLTLFEASWVISMLNVIGALTGVFMGAFADRIGYRRLILSGLLLISIGCIAGGTTAAAAVFFLSRFVEGVGFFFIVLSVPSLIARISDPRHLRLILGFFGTYMPTGIAIMLLLSPYMVDRTGWRGLWLLNGGIGIVFLLLLALSTRNLSKGRESQMVRATEFMGNVNTVCVSPGPLLLALCFFCYAGQWMALMSFLPTFFIEQVGMGKEGAAVWTALAVIVNIPGNIFGGILSQKNVPRWLSISSVFIIVTLFTLGIYSGKTPLMIRLILCLGFSFVGGIIPATLLSAIPYLSPGTQYLGASNGLLMQGSNMGTLLMAPALAAVVSWFGGWHGAPLIFIVSGLIGLVAALAVGKLEKNKARVDREGEHQDASETS